MTTYRHAYLGGTFDCLHRGHLALFYAARRVAERLTVSVNTDAFCARYKRAPLMPLADRLSVLGQCRLVDRVIVNTGDEDSRPAILHAGGVDCVVHGSDWIGSSLLRQMGLSTEWLEAHGVALVILPYTPITSTTAILEAYEARKAPAA